MRGRGERGAGARIVRRRAIVKAVPQRSDEEIWELALTFIDRSRPFEHYAGQTLRALLVDDTFTDQIVWWFRRAGRLSEGYFHLRSPDEATKTLCGKTIGKRQWIAFAERGSWQQLLGQPDHCLRLGGDTRHLCERCEKRRARVPIPSAEEPYPRGPLSEGELTDLRLSVVQAVKELGGVGALLRSDDRQLAEHSLQEAVTHELITIAAERAFARKWWEREIPWHELIGLPADAIRAPEREAFVEAFRDGGLHSPVDADIVIGEIVARCYPGYLEEIRDRASDPDCDTYWLAPALLDRCGVTGLSERL